MSHDTDITIPPGAIEAAAKELYEQERDLGGRPLPSWSDAGRKTKERFYKAARAACLAMIRAWPGMTQEPHDAPYTTDAIILPLTENSNAEG